MRLDTYRLKGIDGLKGVAPPVVDPAYYDLIEDIEVLVNTTSVSLVGLEGTKENGFKLVSHTENGGDVACNLFVNNNQVQTNYYTQYIFVNDTSYFSARDNNANFTVTIALSDTLANTGIKLTNDGYFTYQSEMARGLPNSPIIQPYYGSSTFTMTSITQLDVVATASNAIGVDSRFQLYQEKTQHITNDIEVLVASTQVDIVTDINKGELYEMVTTFVGQTGNPNIRLFANDNNTASSYYTQLLISDSTTNTPLRLNDNIFANTVSGNRSTTKCYVKLTNDGKVVFMSNTTNNVGTSSITLNNFFVTSTYTLTSITKLSLSATVASGIGINSRIQLYKVAEKVGDIEVLVATTQVDITETIEKGNEYLLVSDIIGAVASDLSLNINDITSGYTTQDLIANSTTVAGGRRTFGKIGYVDTSNKGLFITKLKLANSGLFNAQTSELRGFGTSGVRLGKYYGSKSGTITSITKLNIIASGTNGIGIGSRFELYKEK